MRHDKRGAAIFLLLAVALLTSNCSTETQRDYQNVHVGHVSILVPEGWHLYQPPNDNADLIFYASTEQRFPQLRYAYNRGHNGKTNCDIPEQLYPDIHFAPDIKRFQRDEYCIRQFEFKENSTTYLGIVLESTQNLMGIRPLGAQYVFFAAPKDDYYMYGDTRTAVQAYLSDFPANSISRQGTLHFQIEADFPNSQVVDKPGLPSLIQNSQSGLLPVNWWLHIDPWQNTSWITPNNQPQGSQPQTRFASLGLAAPLKQAWGIDTNKQLLTSALQSQGFNDLRFDGTAVGIYSASNYGVTATGTAKIADGKVRWAAYRTSDILWYLHAPEQEYDQLGGDRFMAAMSRWDMKPFSFVTPHSNNRAWQLAALLTLNNKQAIEVEVAQAIRELIPTYAERERTQSQSDLDKAWIEYKTIQGITGCLFTSC